jgi:putative intracellular protease/amidase
MKKILLTTLGVLAAGCVIVMLALPTILHSAGLHPDYAGETFDLPGKRALIICTSHGVLNAPGETDGKPTGVFASELTVPYYDFLSAGMQVDVASIQGGEIPIDPQSFLYMIRTPEDERFQQDPTFQAKVENSLRIDDVDFTAYDAIFMAGGWGAAYDLGVSEVLGQKVSDAYYAESPIIGSVCHGALGLIKAKDKDGNPLISGRRMCGVTDKQVQELGIDMTPQHPETELRKAGVEFESETAFRDMLATHVSVDDEKRFVTGQNQNSAHETAHQMMALIANRAE